MSESVGIPQKVMKSRKIQEIQEIPKKSRKNQHSIGQTRRMSESARSGTFCSPWTCNLDSPKGKYRYPRNPGNPEKQGEIPRNREKSRETGRNAGIQETRRNPQRIKVRTWESPESATSGTFRTFHTPTHSDFDSPKEEKLIGRDIPESDRK